MQQLFLAKKIKPYLYMLSEQELLGVVECQDEDPMKFELKCIEIAQNIVNEYQNIIISIGKRVDCLYDIKISVEHAKVLMKFASLMKGSVMTESLMKEEYKAKASTSDLMTEAIKYINDHFQDDLGIEEVAEKVGLSVSYFSLLFKQKTGGTFLEFLTNKRVEYACLFLQNSQLKTYEIAEKVGYTDQRYFSQVFKKIMKQTPSEYRKGFYLKS
jgi:two-component system response regulator YesN